MPVSSVTKNLAILFADIVGSTSLYDQLGDHLAHIKIVNCLNLMGALVKNGRGLVVGTIGDEIMCSFEDPNDAFQTAIAIQESMQEEMANSIGVRVGMHFGLTGIENGHPFGDVVNVASRMADLARHGRIIISKDTANHLNRFNKAKIRAFDRVRVKGKPQPIETYEIIWDQRDITSIFKGSTTARTKKSLPVVCLSLSYQSFTSQINASKTSLSIGRSPKNDLIVVSENASRNHAVIEYRNGSIFITDHSTNGCYIKTESGNSSSDGLDFFLHRNEWVMRGRGVICLGEPIHKGFTYLIHFSVSHR